MNIQLVKKIVSNSKYMARTWDYEDAFRYILNIDNNILEAGFFVHYKEGKPSKKVIELPTSYGCPIRCKHCASGFIENTKQLSHNDIVNMFNYIVLDNNIQENEKVLLTYSGIGEGSFQKKNLAIASKQISENYKGTYFNLSTVGFDPSFIEFCETLSTNIILNHIQVTYLHYDSNKLSEIIPDTEKLGFNFKNLVKIIKDSKSNKVRFNYVCIKGYNDNQKHWEEFAEHILDIRDQVIIRVSKLNQTEVSKMNKLQTPDIETLQNLKEFLEKRNFNTHVFTPENDNTMNCGQLSWNYLNK